MAELLYNEVADLIILPLKVYFNKDSIGNVLSLKHVAAIPVVYITMDTHVANTILVHLAKGVNIKFCEYVDGLYTLTPLILVTVKLKTTQALSTKVLIYYRQLNKMNHYALREI